MNLNILPSAFADLAQGRDFYDDRNVGLGEYFLDTLFAEIESLRIYAGIHNKQFGYYRLLANRFPYAVYYQIENEGVVVYRVLDCRKKPESIRHALE